MKFRLDLSLLALTVACGPAQEPAPPPAAPTVQPAAAPTAPPEPPPPPPPTPEELAKAEEQKRLEQDYVTLEQTHAADMQRFTPELRAQVQKLIAAPGGLRTKTKAAIGSAHRRPTQLERDAQRHPLELLEFMALTPYQKVLEYGPGEGYYTEILAPVLAAGGKLYVTQANPNGPKMERPTFSGKRTEMFLSALPEAYGKVEPLVFDPAQPKLALEDGKLDAVLLFRGAHGMVNNGVLQTWLAEFHRVLAPRGTLGIEQHRAAPDADPIASSKQGYLPESFVIQQVEAAGFKLLQKSELNANPKDLRDHPNGVWSLPPTLRGGDVGRDEFLAIGESDRMTLRFVKTKKPAAAPSTPAAPSPAAAKPSAPAAAPSAPAAKPSTPAAAAPSTPAAPVAKPNAPVPPSAPAAKPSAPAPAPPAAPAPTGG